MNKGEGAYFENPYYTLYQIRLLLAAEFKLLSHHRLQGVINYRGKVTGGFSLQG